VVTARYVGIEPVEWNDHISMRAGVYVALGTDIFSPAATNPSSVKVDGHSYDYWKISEGLRPADRVYVAGTSDVHQWLAMDTGSVQKIQGVGTQSRGDGVAEWVSSYTVSVSDDASTWVSVDGGSIFTGNTVDTQGDTIVRNDFAAVVTARYVSIEPKSFNNVLAMRAGVYIYSDCDVNAECGAIASGGLKCTCNTGYTGTGFDCTNASLTAS